MTKFEATLAARKLVKALGGKPWTICVWENIGWHYCAEALDGFFTVNGPESKLDKNTYWALCSRTYRHAGDVTWADHYHSKDPKKVVRHQKQLIKKYAKTIQEFSDRVDWEV